MPTDQQLKDFFRNDRFAAHLGIELLEAGPGRARAQLRIEEHHLNAVSLGHGGAIFGLADLVFAVASNSHGSVALGITVSMSYLNAARPGSLLTAQAEEVALNPRLATYTVRITDEQDTPIALMQGTVYRKRETLESCLTAE